MFKKRSFLLITLLITCYVALGSRLFHVTDKKREKYKKTMNALQPECVTKTGELQRGKVSKDIWFVDSQDNQHYIMISEGSTLHLHKMKRTNQTKAIEEMTNITCYLQQKKYIEKNAPRQHICKIQMQEGIYNYDTKEFFGKRAIIDMYDTEGHELTKDIPLTSKELMHGMSDEIHFNLKSNKPQLHAKNLKADIFSRPEDL